MKKESGFTIIELLLVIVIVTIVGLSSAPFLSRFIVQNAVASTTNYLVSTLRKAQSYAMAGKDDSDWQVDIVTNEIRLVRASDGVVFDTKAVYPNVSVTGFTTITYSSPNGLPDVAAESITIVGGNTTDTITTNSQGTINYQ